MTIGMHERLLAIETVDDLIAIYDSHRAHHEREQGQTTNYAQSKLHANEADGAMVMMEKLNNVRAVIADATNRRRRAPRTQKAG